MASSVQVAASSRVSPFDDYVGPAAVRGGAVVDPEDFLPIMRAAADLFTARLKVERVGPDDDFFDLGGGRVSAVWVARRLERVLGRPVPPALLFQARTPRAICAALEGEIQAGTSHLVDLREGGSEPAVFCMPEVYGRPMSFITLADRMPEGQPVIGLAVGPSADALIAERTMDVIAAAYVDAILERQPAGPYRLAGYSFGGMFAQEVAVRLRDLGHEVSLVIIDSGNRTARVDPLRLVWKGSGSLIRSFATERPRAAAAKAKRRLLLLRSYLFGEREVVVPKWVPPADLELSIAHVEAWMAHRPRSFDGPTLIVVCRDQLGFNVFRNADGLIGWSGFLRGPIRRVVAHVGHQEVVREDYADRLASEMTRFFADAAAGTV